MAVYSVFLALGLSMDIRPILDLKDNWFFGRRYKRERGLDFVGDQLKPIETTETGGYEEGYEEVLDSFKGGWLKINWLTEPVSNNVGFVHLTVSMFLLGTSLFANCS